MSTSRWTWTAAVLFAIACGDGEPAQQAPPAEPEPVLAGQPLSYWTGNLTAADPEVRRVTAVAIGGLGAEAEPLIDDLVNLLADQEGAVVEAAQTALRDLGAPGTTALIVALTSHENRTVRSQAAHALGRMRASSPEIVEALAAALSDEAWQVRFRAAEALGALGPDASVGLDRLRAAQDDEDPNVRAAVAAALASVER